MKLITAQELQNMNENELSNFFNSLSENQARREGKELQLQSVGNMQKLDPSDTPS